VRPSRFALPAHHIVGPQQFHLVGGEKRLRQQDPGSAPEPWRCPRASGTSRRLRPIVSSVNCISCLKVNSSGPAQLIGPAIGLALVDEPGDRLRNIAHEDGREFGGAAADQRQEGAKRLKPGKAVEEAESSGPNTIEGRMMMAPGNAARARFSPSAFAARILGGGILVSPDRRHLDEDPGLGGRLPPWRRPRRQRHEPRRSSARPRNREPPSG
jgi:hypothetical protein